MIYYKSDEITIRNMQQSDAQVITDEENAQGWHADIEKYEMHLRHQAEGKAVALVAEYQGNVAGYINVYFEGLTGAFAGQGYPEIVDFGVLIKYRNRGIGSKLMDVAEQIAFQHADMVWLGVGLHYGYGSAQRMYVKRGYIPDGSGVWYRDSVCEQYEDCCNDDDLVLYFSKKLNQDAAKPVKEIQAVDKQVLLDNLDKLHITQMGADRIKKNLKLTTNNVVAYCKDKVSDESCNIYKQGKNWYCEVDNVVITINAQSYTIITAHRRWSSVVCDFSVSGI